MISPWAAVLAGLALLLLGLTHRYTPIAALDARLFNWLNVRLGSPTAIRFFRRLWPLGTTLFTLPTLVLLAIISGDFSAAAFLWGVWLLAAFAERALKLLLQRTRPFEAIEGVNMAQPRQPHDASFPSGDSFRIWYWVLAAIALLNPPLILTVLLIGLAVLVSLGRIALGVHYPLDMLAGIGLGWLAFGCWTWLLAII